MKGAARNRMLDILRIIAMLMVLMVHIPIYVHLPVTFPNGQYGVAVFFVLSGFLIMESLEREHSVRRFYRKRLLRILPEYYIILLTGMIVWDILLGQMPKDVLHLGWFRYFLCLNTIVPSGNYYYWNDLWGLWTISCFMFFYLVAPLIKKWVTDFRKSLVFLAGSIVLGYAVKKLIVIALAGTAMDSVEMFAGDTPFFNLMIFALGVCAWYALREGKETLYLMMCIALVGGLLFFGISNRMTWGALTVVALLAGRGISIQNQHLGGIIDVVSRYSFTIYLVHFPVFQILEYAVGERMSNAVYALVAAVLIVAVSVGIHRLAEAFTALPVFRDR
jgi:peptidoglycan/LPS O-acetylase OafA/YrhL